MVWPNHPKKWFAQTKWDDLFGHTVWTHSQTKTILGLVYPSPLFGIQSLIFFNFPLSLSLTVPPNIFSQFSLILTKKKIQKSHFEFEARFESLIALLRFLFANSHSLSFSRIDDERLPHLRSHWTRQILGNEAQISLGFPFFFFYFHSGFCSIHWIRVVDVIRYIYIYIL